MGDGLNALDVEGWGVTVTAGTFPEGIGCTCSRDAPQPVVETSGGLLRGCTDSWAYPFGARSAASHVCGG